MQIRNTQNNVGFSAYYGIVEGLDSEKRIKTLRNLADLCKKQDVPFFYERNRHVVGDIFNPTSLLRRANPDAAIIEIRGAKPEQNDFLKELRKAISRTFGVVWQEHNNEGNQNARNKFMNFLRQKHLNYKNQTLV